jgi:hypothetical protein
MNNQILMGIVNCSANRLKEFQARIDIKTMQIAKYVNGLAIDVFHDQVSAAIGQGTAIEKMCNIGVIELRQDLALQLET